MICVNLTTEYPTIKHFVPPQSITQYFIQLFPPFKCPLLHHRYHRDALAFILTQATLRYIPRLRTQLQLIHRLWKEWGRKWRVIDQFAVVLYSCFSSTNRLSFSALLPTFLFCDPLSIWERLHKWPVDLS